MDYGTHSALSFAQAWLLELHEKPGWESEVQFLNEVVEIYLAEPQQSRNKLAIDEDIVSKLRKSLNCMFACFSKIPIWTSEKQLSTQLGLAKPSLVPPG